MKNNDPNQLLVLNVIAKKSDFEKTEYLKAKFKCLSSFEVFPSEEKIDFTYDDVVAFYQSSILSLTGAISAMLEKHNKRNFNERFLKEDAIYRRKTKR